MSRAIKRFHELMIMMINISSRPEIYCFYKYIDLRYSMHNRSPVDVVTVRKQILERK